MERQGGDETTLLRITLDSHSMEHSRRKGLRHQAVPKQLTGDNDVITLLRDVRPAILSPRWYLHLSQWTISSVIVNEASVKPPIYELTKVW